jgi:FixJ family two-component response regulator
MICIVDDDPFVRSATADLLQSVGYPAIAFDTAESFLDSAHSKNTDCLILDCNLPGIQGLDLQDHLRAHGLAIAIIFITAFPEGNDKNRALATGAVAYLTKPFSETDLVAAIDAALSSAAA